MASKKTKKTRRRPAAAKSKTSQSKTKPKTSSPRKARSARKAAPSNAQPLRKKASAKSSGAVAERTRAPAFDLANQRGERFSSAALKGRPYVLYFYPKDDTPGCTKEACDFRDSLARLSRSGVEVVGVSPDSTESHERFARKYGLSFTLLSDDDKNVARAYGVWVKKRNYGREYMGIERSTFLVDAKGVVRRAWRGVRVPGHVEAVLAELSAL
jgi:thioredoxin-dependent peroxiredoxin